MRERVRSPACRALRLIGDHGDKFGFDRGINLHLDIAVIGIPIDVLDRLLRSVDSHLGWAGKFPGSIDNSGFQNARAKLGAIVVTSDALWKKVGVVSHVACAGDAVGKIERSLFGG